MNTDFDDERASFFFFLSPVSFDHSSGSEREIEIENGNVIKFTFKRVFFPPFQMIDFNLKRLIGQVGGIITVY